jgi:hypothetical protein
MARFHSQDHPENPRYFGKALFFRNFREIGIEGAPFHALSGRCFLEVFRGRADATGGIACGNLDVAALEERKEQLRVLLFVVGGVREYPGDLFVSLLLRLRGEKRVSIPRPRKP